MSTKPKPSKKSTPSASYNARKEFRGKSYTGMKVGGSHTWDYEPGVWKETKVAPDRWKVDYNVVKRRRGHAPEDSGAPVGTEYHWFIVAHQHVVKTDANTYTTHLHGWKYKLAHKWATSSTWNLATHEQRKERQVAILEDAIRVCEEGEEIALGVDIFDEEAEARGREALKAKSKKRKRLEKGQRTLDSLFQGKRAKVEKDGEEERQDEGGKHADGDDGVGGEGEDADPESDSLTHDDSQSDEPDW
ncbi:hypothetical protein HK104_010249 [Borealophlyctis nickersoniae]|nr:hypothetical protein HK104_010249 [Borealophlyctis nickersoniae]